MTTVSVSAQLIKKLGMHYAEAYDVLINLQVCSIVYSIFLPSGYIFLHTMMVYLSQHIIYMPI